MAGWRISQCVLFVFLLTVSLLESNLAAAEKKAAPGFTLQTLDGSPFVWSEHLGRSKVAVLTFFTSWCQPCMREHPQLQKLYDKYKEKGLLIVAVSADEPGNIARVRTHVQRYKLTFPVLLDSDSSVTRQYDPDQTFPMTLVITPDGAIRKVATGYVPGDEMQLEKEVVAYLEPAR